MRCRSIGGQDRGSPRRWWFSCAASALKGQAMDRFPPKTSPAFWFALLRSFSLPEADRIIERNQSLVIGMRALCVVTGWCPPVVDRVRRAGRGSQRICMQPEQKRKPF